MEVMLFFGAFLLVGFALLALGIWSEKQRTAALQQVSDELGQTFYPSGLSQFEAEHAGFELFARGRSRRLSNLMHGETSAVEVGVFDYRFRTGSGKNSSTHHQTVISFRSPLLDLPQFTLQPEHVFHRLGELFGFADIDFETHPVFSRKFQLKGSNESRVRETFHYDVLEFCERHPGICVEGNRERLLYYRARKRCKPAEIRSLMEEGFELYGLLKR